MVDEFVFRDDESISDNDTVYRRIAPKFIRWGDAVSGRDLKVPSQGFQDQSAEVALEQYGLPGPCMSIELAVVIAELDMAVEDIIKGHPGYGLVSLNVGELRQLKGNAGEDWGQGVMRDPRPNAPWHGVIFCFSGGKKSKGMQTAISRIATWVVVPEQPIR